MKTYKQYISEKMISGGYHVDMYLENPTFTELKGFYLNKSRTYKNRGMKFFYNSKTEKMYYFNPYNYIHSDMERELGIVIDHYKSKRSDYPQGMIDPFVDGEGTYSSLGGPLYKRISSHSLKVLQEFYLFMLQEYVHDNIQKEKIHRSFLKFGKQELNIKDSQIEKILGMSVNDYLEKLDSLNEKFMHGTIMKEYYVNPSTQEITGALDNKFRHNTCVKFMYSRDGEAIYYFDPNNGIHRNMYNEYRNSITGNDQVTMNDFCYGAIDAFYNSEGTYADVAMSKYPLNSFNYNVMKNLYLHIFKHALVKKQNPDFRKPFNRSFLLFYKNLAMSKSNLEKELKINLKELLDESEDG